MAKWPTDKEIEEIYRKGSEQHYFGYDPKAWTQMEALLDNQNRRKWFVWLFSGVVIIAIISSFYFLNGTPPQVGHNDATKNIVLTKPELNHTQSKNTSDHSDTANTVSNLKDGTISQISDITFSETSTGEDGPLATASQIENPLGISPRSTNPMSTKPAPIILTDLYTTPHPKRESNQHNNVNKNLSEGTVALSMKPQKIQTPVGGMPLYDALVPEITMEHLLLIPIRPFGVSFDKHFSVPVLSIDMDIKPVTFKRLIFASALSVESSFTPKGDMSSIDLGIGLNATYLFSQKLGFNIGANYIAETYTAMQSDYAPPKEFWENRGAPTWTAANCKMLELSYGLSYYFNGIDKKGIVTNINLVSNFMLSEDYYYHYTEGSKNFTSSWTSANSTFLSSLSIGTEYRFLLSNNWSFSVGPFAKIPLRGIGHGDVMLSSIGLKFGIGLY